jgi:hypothetical protein
MIMVMHGLDVNFDMENEFYAVNGVANFYAEHPIDIAVGEGEFVALTPYPLELTSSDAAAVAPSPARDRQLAEHARAQCVEQCHGKARPRHSVLEGVAQFPDPEERERGEAGEQEQIGGEVERLLAHGIVLVSLFTLEHESIHGTAFRTPWINIVCAEAVGFLLLLPPRYFRYFHFAHHRHTIALPERTWHPEFMKTGGAEYGLNEKLLKEMLPQLFPAQVDSLSLRLGDLVIVGIPGEMAASLGLKVKSETSRITGAGHPVIGGLADVWVSYILPAAEYRRGGYESSVSFYGETLGDTIVAGALAGVEKLDP